MPVHGAACAAKLISARGVSEVLAEALDRTVQSAVLINSEGKTVVYASAAGAAGDDSQLESVAAIVACLAAHVTHQGRVMLDEETPSLSVIDFQEGRVCFGDIACLTLCLLATADAPIGQLRNKMAALRHQLEQPLSEVFVAEPRHVS